jgi:hypothetical protein
VARISRSQTVVSNTTTRSEEAGVQFPVSESFFCMSRATQTILFASKKPFLQTMKKKWLVLRCFFGGVE